MKGIGQLMGSASHSHPAECRSWRAFQPWCHRAVDGRGCSAELSQLAFVWRHTYAAAVAAAALGTHADPWRGVGAGERRGL